MKSPLRILVNRGWVPKTQVDPLKRQSGQIEDTVTVSGFIRTDEKKFLNFLIQETNNKNKPRTYLFRDVTAMAEMCDSEPVMIELDSKSGGEPAHNDDYFSLSKKLDSTELHLEYNTVRT